MKHLLLFALLLATPAFAQSTAPFTVEDSGRSFRSLQEAVTAIGEGSGSIVVADGSYRDCAVQIAGTIAYRAATPGKAIFDGGTCEGKAALVLRGAGASVDGIVFQNMRVADRNGSGIRLEHGNLTVTRAMFRDSEQGILTGDDPSGAIRIERSTFSGLGGCPQGMCSHSIYIGGYGSLTVDKARFERGTGGHYIKSRAARVSITGSSFDDTRGRATNYMIDLPNGATGRISGNEFVQGRDKENYSAFIAVAAEGRNQTSAGLNIADNGARIAPGVDRNTIFVADWSGDRIALGANRLGAGLKPFEKR